MYRFVFCLLMVVSLASGQVEKISNNIIKNGTSVYSFYTTTSSYKPQLILFRASRELIGYWAMVPGEPKWADIYSTVEAYPDINYLGPNTLRLYFVANVNARTQAIGVALSDILVAEDNRFTPVSEPLITAYDSEVLAHPSLSKEADGSLSLYYYNSTFTSYGNVVKVPLSADGLRVIGAPTYP